MNFVGVCELRSRSAAVWQALDEERHLVVTSNGKPIALLSATSSETFDETLAALRQAEVLRAVESMQQSAREAGADRLSLDEINAEIAAVRRRRTCRVAPRVPGHRLRLTIARHPIRSRP